MHSCSTIGSCRVYAPIQALASEGELVHKNDRAYGYTHTSREAVQQLRFMLNKIDMPAEVWGLIAPGKAYDRLRAVEPPNSDLFIIEVSSLKLFCLDGYALQLNYLNRRFPAVFSNMQASQALREMAANPSRTSRQFFEEQAKALELAQEDLAILERVRYQVLSVDDVEQDLETIKSLVPQVLVVSHVDALTADGERPAGRRECIAAVQSASERTNLQFYNPTEMMHKVGQPFALAEGGSDLAHYSDAFSPILGRDMYSVIQRTIGHQFEPFDATVEKEDEDMISSGQDEKSRLFRAAKDAIVSSNLTSLSQVVSDLRRLGASNHRFELELYRLATSNNAFDIAKNAAQQITGLAPDESKSWLFLLRAAYSTNDVFEINRSAEQLMKMEEDPSSRIRMEALSRIEKLPHMAWKQAQNEHEMKRRYALLSFARNSERYKSAAENRIRRMKSEAVRKLRQLEAEESPHAVEFGQKALSIFGDDPKLLLSLARTANFAKKHALAAASWKKLYCLEPEREDYKNQFLRARANQLAAESEAREMAG